MCCSSSDTYSVLEVCPPAVVHASATCLCITHMKLVPGLLIILQAWGDLGMSLSCIYAYTLSRNPQCN